MIIVTGGAGFIGSNVVRALNEAGESRILIVDRLGKADKWKNLLDLNFLDYEHKDEFQAKLERGLFDSGIWAVFHMGACSSTTEKDADYLMDNNYGFSRRLASRFAAKKVSVSYMLPAPLLTGTARQGIPTNTSSFLSCVL